LTFIQHAIQPEYEKGVRAIGGSREFQPETKIFTQSILEVMAELGMDGAVLLPFSSAGIHHGNDALALFERFRA